MDFEYKSTKVGIKQKFHITTCDCQKTVSSYNAHLEKKIIFALWAFFTNDMPICFIFPSYNWRRIVVYTCFDNLLDKLTK